MQRTLDNPKSIISKHIQNKVTHKNALQITQEQHVHILGYNNIITLISLWYRIWLMNGTSNESHQNKTLLKPS